MATRFTRGEIRNILGDAHTEDIENKLIALHLGVVDPMKDDLARYKADAEKLPGVQKELDDLKAAGGDWETKYNDEHNAFERYKSEIAGKETLAAKKAAYRRLLDAEKINSADAELIIAATKFDDLALGDDGGFTDADKLTEGIRRDYARYIPTNRSKGNTPENPLRDGGKNGANPRAAEIAKAFYERRYGKAPAADGAK